MAIILLLPGAGRALAEQLTIAAAASMRHAVDEIAQQYQTQQPQVQIEVIYGSSGKLATQIINGAPFALLLSADMARPQQLQQVGHAATEPQAYAAGRIVLWGRNAEFAALQLSALTDSKVRRLAIAQPAHAPYGQLAQQALEQAGVWQALQPKLVFGENIAQAAQMVQSGAADAGIVALSLALNPHLTPPPHYRLLDASLHQPLLHGMVVTRYGSSNPTAQQFADFMLSTTVTDILLRHGFERP